MVDKSNLADIPLARQGFDALGMTAPVLVQVNPDGEWEKDAPNNLDEERLRAIVKYLVNSDTVTEAKSYCTQCCAESQQSGGNSSYVPVIMMPIFPADQCPFDVQCEMKKMEESKTDEKKTTARAQPTKEAKDSKTGKKKKRGYVLQRFSDFDYNSQW